MKKILALVLCVSVLGVLAAGCSGGEKAEGGDAPKKEAATDETK